VPAQGKKPATVAQPAQDKKPVVRVAWKNLDDEHKLGQSRVKESRMVGKVVLVCRWGSGSQPSRAFLESIEPTWKCYRAKPFVVIGSHQSSGGSAEAAKEFCEQSALTFPVYADVELAEGAPADNGLPFFYIVDETGKVTHQGKDEHKVTEYLAEALAEIESPKDVEQWKRFLDFELKTIPGRGFLRLEEFRKKHPEEAKAYDAEYKRLKNTEVKKLSDLVAFAKNAKECDPNDKKATKTVNLKTIGQAIHRYDSLKKNKNPLVAQEAENALKDLEKAREKFQR